MKTAIISDIHGNLAALKVALEDIDRHGCDRVFCLGDLVEGGLENEAVVCEVQQRGIFCVKGNHDEINDLALAEDIQAYLRKLPEQLIEDDVFYTHISPRLKKRKINSAVEAWNVFDEFSYRLLFVGHVHYPLLFGEQSSETASAQNYTIQYNQALPLDPQNRYIICVGAIGYGRDQIGKIRYCIYDSLCQSIEFRALNGPLLDIDWSYSAR